MRVSTSTVTVAAPREVVWAALTEPAYVKQWQYGSDLDTDWAVGSPIRFTASWDGQTFRQWGSVLSVDPPRELRYSLFAPRPGLNDKPENRFTMTYRLSEGPDGTVVTFVQEDPRSTAADATGDDENPVLVALKSVAESIRP
jgi:uncharacterized protein YndB with AHSA1/START domain